MNRIIVQSLHSLAALLLSTAAFSQVSLDFNTNNSTPETGQIRGFLQDRCWVFSNMDVSQKVWDGGIDGNGALISSPGASRSGNASIYTPMLRIEGAVSLSFRYKLTAESGSAGWLKMFLLSHDNQVVRELDNVQLNGRNPSPGQNYDANITNLPSGAYKIQIAYSGVASIAIDDLKIGAQLLYSSGCNQSPVAGHDQVYGNENRTATGQLFTNDFDPNGDVFTAYVIKPSPDGNVVIAPDGSFTFTPNEGFSGNSTSFSYQVCDAGFGPSCGNSATVTINFATASMPVRLSDFTVSINDGRDAVLRWTTAFEQGSDHFEIERSTDGVNFESAGTVKASGTSFSAKDYSFTDKLRSGIATKKDIFYRIRMVDVNQRAELSRSLVLRLYRTASLTMVSITPNPVINDINVQVQLKENSYVVMKVTNSAGVEVSRKSIRGNEGVNVFALDGTGKLQPGTYMLEVIINSSERMTTKLVKS